jgi:hypothetical protein
VPSAYSHHPPRQRTQKASDVKGRASSLMYGLGIGLSFANRWADLAACVAVAIIWFIPDRRVERTLSGPHEYHGRIPP